MGQLYKLNIVHRTLLIWIVFQVLLWSVFFVGFLTHRAHWENNIMLPPQMAAEGDFLSTLAYILMHNILICLLIVAGNLFVRFGWVTPGLAILLLQAINIGWLAGSNGFEVPFATVSTANIQYLRIGLWETTAYTIACAVTLPKSLLVAATFPAKKWESTRKWNELKWNKAEKWIAVLGGTVLLFAAVVEAWHLTGG